MFSTSMPAFAAMSSMAAVQTTLPSSACLNGGVCVVRQAPVYPGEMTMFRLPPRLFSMFWMSASEGSGHSKKPVENTHPENREIEQEPRRDQHDGYRGYPEPRYAPPASPFHKSYKPSRGF